MSIFFEYSINIFFAFSRLSRIFYTSMTLSTCDLLLLLVPFLSLCGVTEYYVRSTEPSFIVCPGQPYALPSASTVVTLLATSNPALSSSSARNSPHRQTFHHKKCAQLVTGKLQEQVAVACPPPPWDQVDN